MIGGFLDLLLFGLGEINGSIVREQVNGLWFILALELFILFVDRARRQFVLIDKQWPGQAFREKFHYWRRVDAVARAAIAWSVYFAAETLMRGWIWMLLKKQNDGTSYSKFENAYTYPVAIASSVGAIVGALCVIRMFAPRGHGNKAWALSLSAAILFLVVAGFF